MTNPRDDLMALAPCPFCHGAAYLHEQEGQRPEDTRYSVHCDECDATHDAPSKDAAVAAWNRRTAASRPAEPVEAVKQWFVCYDGFGGYYVSDTAKDQAVAICFDEDTAENIATFFDERKPTTPDAVGEPVAWRWRFEDKETWSVSQKPASWVFDSPDIIYEPLYTHPPKSPDTSAAVLQSHALKQALDCLSEIAAAHIPDCPAHYAGDELSWVQRHVGSLRLKAEIARDGIAAAIRQLPTPERGDK